MDMGVFTSTEKIQVPDRRAIASPIQTQKFSVQKLR